MKRLKDKLRKRLKRKLRVRKKISGTQDRPRMTVFKSNRHTYVQIVDDTKGFILLSASNLEKDLRNLNNNTEGCTQLGKIIGQRLKDKKIKSIVFDRNGYLFHGNIKALADAVRKEGIQF